MRLFVLKTLVAVVIVLFYRRIKEQHCYCAPDLAKEYSKYDKDPRKFFRMYTGKRVREGTSLCRLSRIVVVVSCVVVVFEGLDCNVGPTCTIGL